MTGTMANELVQYTALGTLIAQHHALVRPRQRREIFYPLFSYREDAAQKEDPLMADALSAANLRRQLTLQLMPLDRLPEAPRVDGPFHASVFERFSM
jgi:hypothetical protein